MAGRRRTVGSVLGELSGALQDLGVAHMVIGGLAVVIRGVPRFTHDIDLAVDMDAPAGRRLLRRLGSGWRAATDDPVGFAEHHGVLPLHAPGGHRVDLVLVAVPFEQEALRRATPERVGRRRVPVCRLEDLVLYKLAAQRPQDLEDVRALLLTPEGRRVRERLGPRVEVLADSIGRRDMLERWHGIFAIPPAPRPRRRRHPR